MAGSRSASAIAEPAAAGFAAAPARRRARRWRRGMETPRTFLLASLLLVLGLAGWASVAVVDQVVRVDGRIVPAGRLPSSHPCRALPAGCGAFRPCSGFAAIGGVRAGT